MTDEQRSQILAIALGLRGIPYGEGESSSGWEDVSARPRALDDATFVCRVAAEAGLYRPGLLVADAGWLLDHLVPTEWPRIGDIVGYARPPNASDRRHRLHHVMIYAGNGNVIGACSLAGKVVMRPVEYEASDPSPPWQILETPSFRVLHMIF